MFHVVYTPDKDLIAALVSLLMPIDLLNTPEKTLFSAFEPFWKIMISSKRKLDLIVFMFDIKN